MKIVFFGSDQYSSIVLSSLQKNPDIEVVRVIKEKNDLEGLKDDQTRPDIGIVASFGTLIPQDIIDWPKLGLLNLHPSLLPKYRGPTPVPTAILNNEKETGLTIIKVDAQIDHGPIVVQFKEEIKNNETSDDLLKRLFTKGTQNLVSILPDYLEGKIKPKEQDHLKATFTQKLTRESGKIDWSKPVNYQERFVRAMFPWPGTWTEIKINQENKRLKILKAHLENEKLVLDEVQLEGKNLVSFKQFQEGYPQAKITK